MIVHKKTITMQVSIIKSYTVFDLDTGDGEFSYPCIVAEENILYISYTWKRKAIRYFELEYIGA